MEALIVILVFGAVAAFGWWEFRAPLSRHWLPRPLRDADLVYAERTFRSYPMKIVARLDRAYRRAGIITLVEFKTRGVGRPYESDIIELSAQRCALADETGEPVDDFGYVVTQDPGGQRRSWHRVRLLSRGEVARLVEYRRAVIAGTSAAAPARRRGLCAQCGHLASCSRAYGDRAEA